ncbi:hypothetical protein F751_0112 [Auxenochlorella protothecoides]|uniref:Uncharacterized protein n=1 Tax=Auxenochlorella protothecoides TaxID=3075 RepID=A0A087S9S1_AUXPR|nr:hypothetical protein F751_0112 [Auxenochlorella protothecoides]KFM22475.1 hypothetical protein F751_0112 [Auxenochlorella protothecoides]
MLQCLHKADILQCMVGVKGEKCDHRLILGTYATTPSGLGQSRMSDMNLTFAARDARGSDSSRHARSRHSVPCT